MQIPLWHFERNGSMVAVSLEVYRHKLLQAVPSLSKRMVEVDGFIAFVLEQGDLAKIATIQ